MESQIQCVNVKHSNTIGGHGDVDFNQLRPFFTVAQEGNLTRAAQRLHLTPSLP